MRHFFQFLPILVFLVLSSCRGYGTDDEGEYYVRYEAEAVSEAVAVEEHPIATALLVIASNFLRRSMGLSSVVRRLP